MNDSRVLRFPAASPALPDDSCAFPFLDGESAAATRLRAQLSRVAPYFRAVLLTGEAGAGAEHAATMLHAGSPGRGLPLRRLSPDAAEACFAQNHSAIRAMVFLENAEALSPAAQRGLLRWMRQRGPQASRVIAAAETDLRGLVSAGRFSAELASRLAGLRIALPSLRDRVEDIPKLLEAAVASMQIPHDRLSAPFVQAACEYAWPRNLTEFQNVMNWLRENRKDSPWQRADFEAACSAGERTQGLSASPVRMVRLEAVIQEHLRAVLAGCFGNKQKAAEVLGISRSTLYRMLDAGCTSGLAQAS